MLNKKAQISIFIIISILLIGIFILLFSFRAELNIKNIFSPKINSLTNQISFCVEKVLFEGLEEIGLRGGYYSPPNLSRDFLGRKIPYYWYIKEDFSPNKTILERSISNYLENNLIYCVENITNSDYTISFEEISVKSNLFKNKIILDINYPLTLKNEKASTKITNFKFEFNSPFYGNYLLIKDFLFEQEKNPSFVPLGFLADLSEKNNFYFDTFYFEEDVVYLLIFNYDSKEQIIYSFANKYFWEKNET